MDGSHDLHRDGLDYALLGAGVQHELSITLDNRFAPMSLLYPKAGKFRVSMDPDAYFTQKNILAGGVFLIEQRIDDSYIFVPLEFARDLLNYGTRRTALEVKVKAGQDIERRASRRSRSRLGAGFKVLDSDEQHVSLLKAIKVEKMFVFITFAFILLIASINIFFSLSMLVIDKKKDMAVLMAMGAGQRTIRNIFLFEGAIVAQVGAITGLVLGVSICWLQQTFHVVSMGMATSVVDSYPVKMQLSDVVLTGVAIIFITIAVSIRPALNASRLDVRDNL